MDRHRRIIGLIFFLIGILFCFILVRVYGRFDSVQVQAWQQFIFTLMAGLALLQLATGYRLLFDKPWSRRLCVFIAAFDLIIFPVGTFAGAYYFWYYLKFIGKTKTIY